MIAVSEPQTPPCPTCGGRNGRHVRGEKGWRRCPECFDDTAAVPVPRELRQRDVSLPPDRRPDRVWPLLDRTAIGMAFDEFRYRAWWSLTHWYAGQPTLVVHLVDVGRIIDIQFGRDDKYGALTELSEPDVLIVTVPRASGRHRNPPELAQVIDARRRAGRATWLWSDLSANEFANAYEQAAEVLGVQHEATTDQQQSMSADTPGTTPAAPVRTSNRDRLRVKRVTLNSGNPGLSISGGTVTPGQVVHVGREPVTVGVVVWSNGLSTLTTIGGD